MTKKENQNRGPQMNSPTLPQKIIKFSATSPVRIRRSGQAFMVIGSRIATNYGRLYDTNTTFHLPFASKVKFSSRVHSLNKIGKKTLRTENRIILTPSSSEKSSPKRVALIINI